MTEKSLTKKDEAAIAIQNNVFADSSGACDDFGVDDVTIPRLQILQSLSPQVQENSSAYVKGADPGMIFDSVNETLASGEGGINVLPIHFRSTFNEWEQRSKGGGFVADHGNEKGAELLQTCHKNDKNHDILPSGNQLVKTFEYIAFVLTEDGFYPCIINMSMTQIKYAKRFNTQLTSATIPQADGKSRPAPAYYREWNFSTKPESNDIGHWFSWNITPGKELFNLDYPWLTDHAEFAKECEKFRKSIQAGSLKTAAPINPEGTNNDPEAV